MRINGADSEWFAADLELLMLPGVAGVILPKTENSEAIAAVVAIRSLPVVPLIETALGLWNIERIARAPGVACLAFGSVDFQLDTGISGEAEELLFARSQLVLVSRVAGIAAPVDGVSVAIDDEVAFAADVARAKRLGFRGKLCIHPKQVAMVNAGFSPQPAELAWARQVVAVAQQAAGNAVRLDGRFIDTPIIERARALLAAADKAGVAVTGEVLGGTL